MFFKNFLRSFRTVGDIFKPPFGGLWLVVTLYFLWTYLVYPHSPTLRGDLPDTDDYMYLTQVLDWLKGQGWYDNIQYRLDPPHGVPIHFSRLAMLPMAGMMKVFQLLGLGPKGSAQLMAIFLPVMLLGVFFLIMRWMAETFVPKKWAGVTSFVGIFATQATYQFQPGHVDHHHLIIMLVAVALGCAARMMLRPDMHRWPFLAGLIMAFALVIALEVLPWLLLLSAFLGFWVMIKGGNAARGGLLYALTLFVGSALGLLVTRPPTDLFNLDVLAYSITYVILTGCIAVAFAGVYLATRAPMVGRIIVGLALAVGAGLWFLKSFPMLIGGPYGGIDPELVRIILNEINEAQPLKTGDNTWFNVFWLTASIVVALPACFVFLRRAVGLDRWLWALATIFLIAGTGLTYFYQRRFIGVMNMAEIVPLSTLLYRGWGWIGANFRGRKQFFAEMGLILLVGPLPAVLFPALIDNRSFNIGVILFPVSISIGGSACETFALENALRDPMKLGRKQLLIMNTMGSGPELLFRTNHKILSAPYHMNVQGNVDSARFFSTPYPDEAEAIARRRHVDLVVACNYVENFYFHGSATDSYANNSGPGRDFAPHFVELLIQGRFPPWLKPIKVPGLTNYVIYEVVPEAKEGARAKKG